MCRLLALPPGATPEEAYAAIATLEGTNKDGVGVGFFRSDGTPSITKYPEAVSEVVKKKLPLFDHMPHEGWTIAHTRFKTHGDQNHDNTHPFLIGDYIFAHNGVFHESFYCRVALNGLVQFKSDTDSEIAGWLLNKYGPEKFSKYIETGGVYMALHKSGELHIIKTTGDLEFASVDEDDKVSNPEGQVVIASEIDWAYHGRRRDFNKGLIKLSKEGFLVTSPGSSEPWSTSYHGYRGGRYGCGSRGIGLGCSSDADDIINGTLFSDNGEYLKSRGATKTMPSTSMGLWDLDPDQYVVSLIDGD